VVEELNQLGWALQLRHPAGRTWEKELSLLASSDIPSNERDAAADLSSSMESMRVSPGRPPGDELHSLCAFLSKEQAVVRLQAEMVRTCELTLQLEAARKALDLATSDQSQIAAVVVMLRSESAGLVKKDSPLCWSSRDEITSYFDLDILGKAEATQRRAKVLWQLLVEGVLNHGTDEVGSARYSPRYYHRGLFSAFSALLKLRSAWSQQSRTGTVCPPPRLGKRSRKASLRHRSTTMQARSESSTRAPEVLHSSTSRR
ncbi:hypothetical protein B484DRAFT_434772, partial [Ochromonadaceae sp. CCMP2298]